MEHRHIEPLGNFRAHGPRNGESEADGSSRGRCPLSDLKVEAGEIFRNPKVSAGGLEFGPLKQDLIKTRGSGPNEG